MLLLIHTYPYRQTAKNRFNTSHVTINPLIPAGKYCTSCVSIHLMLLLIQLIGPLTLLDISFNTSHVTINPQKSA